ncbi:HD domain-containing protein [bacterium]|nr:HD domain-containing protein [bacterium]
MGIEIFNPSAISVGLNSNIKFNRFGNKVYFGQTAPQDSFQNTSYVRFFDEKEIRKMISQSPELRKILSENKMPVRLNMKELQELKNGHCQDTQNVAVNIAKNLPPALKSQFNMKDLKDGAILHDFGKVLIPTEILNKNGALTSEEHKIMDLHSELGYELLKNTGVNEQVLKLVRYHHDNYNNLGNTDKSFVPDINLQILNLADKYSALTEKRVYKEEFSPKKALTILYSEVKNGKIHPFLFNALVKSVREQETMANVTKC